MPDLQQLIREKVGALSLPAEVEQEIIAELAAHLEDRCDHLQRDGAGASAALAQAMQDLGPGRKLGRRIARAKEDWMSRTHRLLVPAATTMMLTAIFQFVQNQLWEHHLTLPATKVLWTDSYSAVVTNPGLLAASVLIGAVGAYLSRRNGGTIRDRVLAVLAPASGPAVVTLVGVFIGVVLTTGRFPRQHELELCVTALIGWTILPALFLLLGGAPFLRGKTKVPEPPRAAAHA